MERYFTLTQEQINLLVSAAARGEAPEGMTLSVWEKGAAKRLYVGWNTKKNGTFFKAQTWLDLKDVSDTTLDFSVPGTASQEFAIEKLAAFIAALEPKPAVEEAVAAESAPAALVEPSVDQPEPIAVELESAEEVAAVIDSAYVACFGGRDENTCEVLLENGRVFNRRDRGGWYYAEDVNNIYVYMAEQAKVYGVEWAMLQSAEEVAVVIDIEAAMSRSGSTTKNNF